MWYTPVLIYIPSKTLYSMKTISILATTGLGPCDVSGFFPDGWMIKGEDRDVGEAESTVVQVPTSNLDGDTAARESTTCRGNTVKNIDTGEISPFPL